MRREALFPKMINDMGIDIGVEVGVAGGNHAINLLNNSNLSKLHCIDPYPDDLIWAKEKCGDNRYMEALTNLQPWIVGAGDTNRCELIRENSLDVVKKFDDESIGFVYLDGDRTPNIFRADMSQWLSKIKMGGILAGHDYKNKRGFTVKDMVDDFCEKNNYSLDTTTERCRRWWFIKTH